jgi:hypothetical protein
MELKKNKVRAAQMRYADKLFSSHNLRSIGILPMPQAKKEAARRNFFGPPQYC